MKFIILFLFATASYAATLKKVLILDIKNIRKESKYTYLENTITETIRKKLKARFAFKETSKIIWGRVAESNFIFADDLYTPTAALNLGLLAKQDLVIFGGFFSSDKKGRSEIITTFRIIDVSKRKQISKITITTPVDNKIFTSIDEISEKITKEASAVLPNKEEWQGAIALEDDLDFYNQLTVYSGFHAVALGAAKDISQGSSISATHLKTSFNLGLEFQRYGIFRNAISVFGQIDYRLASGDVAVNGISTTVPATLSSLSFTGGGAYRFFFDSKLYAQVYSAMGLASTSIDLNFSESGVKATDSSGAEVSLREYSTVNLIAKIGARGGYWVMPWLLLELGINYNLLFYSDKSSQTINFELRAGFPL